MWPYCFIFQTSFLKRKIHCAQDKSKADEIIQLKPFFQIKHRKQGKHRQGDDFLQDFQLKRAYAPRRAIMIGRYGQAIFKQGNTPRNQHDFPQRHHRIAWFDVPIPRKRHQHIGQYQQA